MSGPSKDIEPSELFIALQQRPWPSEVLPFPRRTPDGKAVDEIRIRVLCQRDHQVAQMRAALAFKRQLEKEQIKREELDRDAVSGMLGDLTARELLCMACVSAKNHGDDDKPFYPRLFADAEQLGGTITTDELSVLFQAYLLVQFKWGPFEKTVQTEAELSEWIQRLYEGAAQFPLSQISSAHWAELASLLAARTYLLSAILDSLFPSLPSTLQSRLATFNLGTGLFGKRADGTPSTGMALLLSDGEVDLDDAKRNAIAMKAAESESGIIAELLDEFDESR